MTETRDIRCDACGAQLNVNESAYPDRYCLALVAQGLPKDSPMTYAVVTPRPPEPRHFCNHECLFKWLGEREVRRGVTFRQEQERTIRRALERIIEAQVHPEASFGRDPAFVRWVCDLKQIAQVALADIGDDDE